MKFRLLLMRLGMLAVSGAVALLICEAIVRVVAPQQLIVVRPDVWHPVEELGWQKRPNVDTRINTGEREVRLRTDEHGFRIGDRGRFPADLNILLVGDSFMEAIQVEYEESLAGVLEERLGEALESKVAVWNTAVSGWGPSQYLIQVRTLMEDHEFDLVVVSIYLGNDFEAVRHDAVRPREFVADHPLRWPRELSWKEFIGAVLFPINDYLERRSQLFQLLKTQQQALLMRFGLTARYFPEELLEEPKIEQAWRGTAATLRALVDLTTREGVPTRIVVLPSHYQLDEAALDQYLVGFEQTGSDVQVERPNRMLAAALADEGVLALDATPALRSAHQRGEQVHGAVDTHLSPRGHEVVGELLIPELRAALTDSATGSP